MYIKKLLFVVFGVGVLLMCEGRRSRPRFPLKGERDHRKSRRSTECRMGRHRYELEEVWNPDLGPPFGTMYCIRCECVPIKRKRRIKGKTRCKNIRNECPKPMCVEPVLLAGECCKTCPGPLANPLLQDPASNVNNDDTDRTSKDFMCLLVGGPESSNVEVASGRLLYKRRSLYYSIYYVGTADLPPTSIQFVHPDGDILEEQPVTVDKDGRGCGVWDQVPRVYRALVKEEQLRITLVASSNRTLSGRLTRNAALATELLVGTLVPSIAAEGGGATAVVSVSTSTGSIHISLLVAGVIPASEITDIPLLVTLQSKDDQLPLIEEIIRVPKPFPDFNKLELKSTLNPSHLRRLARGKLSLLVQAKNAPEYSVGGLVTPAGVCKVFSTVMTSDRHGSSEAGYTLVHIGMDGSMEYEVGVRWLEGSLSKLSLEHMEKRKLKPMYDMLPDFQTTGEFGLAKGAYSKVNVRELESLMEGDVYVEVGEELKGRLMSRLRGPALVGSSLRYFLTSSEPHPVGALVWINLEDDCSLDYDVEVSGFPADILLRLELVEEPKPAIYPVRRHLLRKFSGPRIDGSYSGVEKSTLRRLRAGHTSIVISSDVLEIRAVINDVVIPPSCLSTVAPAKPGYPSELYMDSVDEDEDLSLKCVYYGSVYDDGAHWVHHRNNCTMCSCQRRKVSCQMQICPPLQCEKTVLLPGECCPACMNAAEENSTQSLERGRCRFEDGSFHAAGTSWHPYLPTFGFTPCAICNCHPDTLTVTCDQIKCPVLNCSQSEAVRDSSQSCCKKCAPPPVALELLNPNSQGDQGSEKTAEEILSEGGCRFSGEVHSNGAEWNPRVQPYGIIRCVTCTCKDGETKCRNRKKKCKKLKCPPGHKKVSSKKSCCHVCVERTSRRKFA